MLAGLGSHPWAYPMLEVVHIVGVALLLGNLVLIESRVWGFAPSIPVEPLARLGLVLAGAGFSMCVVTGLLMFGTMPEELLANRVFTAKMALIMMAGLNALGFHARDSLQRLDGAARILMAVSTVLWLLVITCGRWIGYV